jgi:hypothetical protein
MRTRMTTINVGFAAALLALAAMQFPGAALALNPQPEVPSKPAAMPNPEPEPHPDPSVRYKARLLVTPVRPANAAYGRKGASPFSVPANWRGKAASPLSVPSNH